MMEKEYEIRYPKLEPTDNGGWLISYTKYEKKKDNVKNTYNESCYCGDEKEAYSSDDEELAFARIKQIGKTKTVKIKIS